MLSFRVNNYKNLPDPNCNVKDLTSRTSLSFLGAFGPGVLLGAVFQKSSG